MTTNGGPVNGKYGFEQYEDGRGEWRWRLVAANGRLIAESGEGYASRSNLRRALRKLATAAALASLS